MTEEGQLLDSLFLHGQNDPAPENPRHKSPIGRMSSTVPALPSEVASITGKVQGDECFDVEEILEWRQGEEGLEYLVKWQAMGRSTILGNPLRISNKGGGIASTLSVDLA